MTGPDYAARRGRLIRRLKSSGLAALLVSGESNVRYLTGFTGDSSWLFVSRDNTLMISDARYTTQISDQCPGLDMEIRGVGQSMSEVTSRIVKQAGVSRLGIEGDHLTVTQHAGLENSISTAELTLSDRLTEQLRMIKDKWEIARTREAVTQAERGMAVTRASLTADQNETEIRYGLEAAMRRFGAVGPAFEPIVGVGPTSALPHAHAGQRRLSESPLLLIDWGAESPAGYRSDLTRVFFAGRPTKKMQTVYETVLKAQQEAIGRIRPGAVCREIDGIARGIISDAGYGRRFGHGLGHGVGLDIHEAVRLGPDSEETLKPGMIVTVEPGIYLPGQFGVRIEDDVLVTRDGYEVLTAVPREFDEALVEYLA